MTLEIWWLTIKLRRFSQYRSLPLLLDKQGTPFVFGMPKPVLEALHHIDQDASGTVAMDFPHTGQQDRDTYLVRSLNRGGDLFESTGRGFHDTENRY